MGICPGDIRDEIRSIFHIIIAIGGESHQIGAAALALHHVADGFFIQFRLGGHSDHQGAVLNEGNGSVFQFSGGVCLGMNVADFLHFQAAFHADGVVQPSSGHSPVWRRTTGAVLYPR